MRKFLVFETNDDAKKVEVTSVFIHEAENAINKFNSTGEIDDSETATALAEKCPVDMSVVKRISIIFEK